MDTFALIVTIGVALGFTYTNGFHDSANAIATSVSTRALTPRAALAMAAVMNLAGAFLGQGVAKTVSEGLIATPVGQKGMGILFAALVGAIIWNLITWYYGLPPRPRTPCSAAWSGRRWPAARTSSGPGCWRRSSSRCSSPRSSA